MKKNAFLDDKDDKEASSIRREIPPKNNNITPPVPAIHTKAQTHTECRIVEKANAIQISTSREVPNCSSERIRLRKALRKICLPQNLGIS